MLEHRARAVKAGESPRSHNRPAKAGRRAPPESARSILAPSDPDRIASHSGKALEPGPGSAFEMLELVLHLRPVVRIGQRVLAFDDRFPALRQLCVEGDEGLLIIGNVVLGENGLDRAFGHTKGAVDALVGIDDQEIGAFRKQSTGQTSTQSVYLHLMQDSVTT